VPVDDNDRSESGDDADTGADIDSGGDVDAGGDDAGGVERDASTDTGGGAADKPAADEQYCSSCGEIIKKEAEICPECGVRQKSPAGGGTASGSKDRTTAGILALLLGGIGAHKFYLGDTGLGILYLCFFWTFIPALVGLIEGILYLTKTDEEFQQQYVD
jgi:TM2 domain-containing membrane protein YozV